MSSETPTSLAIEIEGSMRAATDELLTLAARSGNSSAFVELGRRHSKRIQHRIYGILGNWEDAEDALQTRCSRRLGIWISFVVTANSQRGSQQLQSIRH